MKVFVSLLEPDHDERWPQATEEERATFFAALEAFSAEVARLGGSVLAGEGLASSAASRTLGPGPERMVTEGPYAESAEQLGGFYLIEVADLDTGVAAARLLPDRLSVELRPAMMG